MKLFRKKGKETEILGNSESVKGADAKVLGSGCAKCNELTNHTKEALKQLGLSTDIEKVTNLTDIATYGVMSTPALVYRGKVMSYGKVLSIEQIKELLRQSKL